MSIITKIKIHNPVNMIIICIYKSIIPQILVTCVKTTRKVIQATMNPSSFATEVVDPLGQTIVAIGSDKYFFMICPYAILFKNLSK